MDRTKTTDYTQPLMVVYPLGTMQPVCDSDQEVVVGSDTEGFNEVMYSFE